MGMRTSGRNSEVGKTGSDQKKGGTHNRWKARSPLMEKGFKRPSKRAGQGKLGKCVCMGMND